MVGRGGNSLCRCERASGPSHHLRDRGGLDDGPRLRRSGLLDVLLRRHHYRIILAVAAVATPDGEDDDEERRKGNDEPDGYDDEPADRLERHGGRCVLPDG